MTKRHILAALTALGTIGGAVYHNAANADPNAAVEVSKEWKSAVDSHLVEGSAGLSRLTELEKWACRFELRFLEQNRWMAEQARDRRRMGELSLDIARLQKRAQCND